MKKQALVAGLMLTFVLGVPVFSYAGKVELTTYYPAPYGEYTELKATGQTANNGDIALEAKGNAGTGLVVTNANQVGIGTASPSALFEVQNGIASASSLNAPGQIRITSGYAQLDFIDSDHNDWAIHVNDNKMYFIRQPWNHQDLVLNGSGNVGIGTSTPSYKLDVNGEIASRTGTFRSTLRSNFILRLQSDRNMVLYDNGAAVWSSGTQTSDIRLKKNITDLGPVLGILENLNPIRFYYKEGVYDENPHIGLSAQEVESFFPELVYTAPEAGNKLVFYDKLTVILVQALKDLKKEKDEEIKDLRGRIEALEQRLNDL